MSKTVLQSQAKYDPTPTLPDFSWFNVPNILKYQQIYQMTLKYTKTFHSKAARNVPKLGFWYENTQSGNPDQHFFKSFFFH
jgi:hypothetical protein